MITDMKDAKIFSPLQLGRTTLKNRIAMAPMSMHYEATNGTVPKQLADIFVRRQRAAPATSSSTQSRSITSIGTSARRPRWTRTPSSRSLLPLPSA